jgi:hypothetical protein
VRFSVPLSGGRSPPALASAGYDRSSATNMVARLVPPTAWDNGRNAFLAAVPRVVGSRCSPVAGSLWLGAVCVRDLEAAISRAGFPGLDRSVVFRRFRYLLHAGNRV